MQNVGNGLKKISLAGRGHMLKTLESKDNFYQILPTNIFISFKHSRIVLATSFDNNITEFK